MNRQFFCVARGRDDRWEGLCLDLDLAVQGHSFDEVCRLLNESVSTYLEDAASEAEPARSQLLARRVPAYVRFLWGWRFFRATISGRGPDGDSPVWLPVTCHA